MVAYQSPNRFEDIAGLGAGRTLSRRSSLAVQRTVSIWLRADYAAWTVQCSFLVVTFTFVAVAFLKSIVLSRSVG